MSACSKFSCSGELLLELMQGCSPQGVSHFLSARLWLRTEDGNSSCGATAGTEGSVPEEPAAPRNAYGQKDGDNKGQPGGSGRKMVITVSKEGERTTGKDCKSFQKGGLGKLVECGQGCCVLSSHRRQGRGGEGWE